MYAQTFQIEEECKVRVENQRLTFRAGPGKEPVQLSANGATLKSLGLMNGDMLNLDSPETSMSEAEKSEVQKSAEEAAFAHSVQKDRLGVVQAVSAMSGKEVKEDEIDIVTHATDGWVKRNRSGLCQHPTNGTCQRCMPIPPWDIQNHPDFADLNLKHIPFHAWLREKEYRSPNNPVFLEDPTWRVDVDAETSSSTSTANGQKSSSTSAPNPGNPTALAKGFSARGATLSVVLERQPYRHVDHIEFEDPKMLDNFIGAWRASGRQRCGFLLGRYIREPSGIPLGIAAQVVAIYEPPQRGSVDEVSLLKDANEARVDEICEKFGLVRVGFVWTALRVDAQRKIIPDRDVKQYTLNSQECLRMAALQNKYASPSARSNTGKFGSKFVSVLVYGNQEGNIEIAAYQMSNQVCRLVRDGVVKATKKEPGHLRVRASDDHTIFPDVYYSHKNEYNLLVQSKADPTFPNDFGIVSVRHAFPKDPNPLFKRCDFPVEHRIQGVPNLTNVQAALQGKRGNAFFDALSDFHLVLFLAISQPQLLPLLTECIKPERTIKESDIRPEIEKLLPTASLSSATSSSTPVSSSSPKPTVPNGAGAAAQNQLSERGKDIVAQLVSMGFEQPRAAEAVWATNTAGVDQALNFLMAD